MSEDSGAPDYLDDLNTPQREAVLYNDGPALVVAGAGSGKTRVLIYKLLHLIRSGYQPRELMALTFTNKAAREMRERMLALVGRQAYAIRMGTFHSIFLSILRQYADRLGYSRSFTVYNSTDSKNKIKSIIKLMALDDKTYKPGVVHARISHAKNRLQTPEVYRQDAQLLKQDAQAGMPRLSEIYQRYTVELKQANAMDFDDLLLQTNILFRDHPDVLEIWRHEVGYLLIDEYQDTNFAQYMIARQLMQERGKIFVVGDDAQSIYSFRGAHIENILGFQRSFAGARVFKLEQNYRSSQTIVQAASGLIAHNEHQIPKEVFSRGEIGAPIAVHEALSGEGEANWLCHTLETMHEQMGVGYDQCAVLYRTNQQSRLLEQKLRSQAIPFRIWGGRSFFDHKEVMDVLAYLRLMVNASDDEALFRIINYPKRGIGDTTIAKIRQCATASGVRPMDVLRSPNAYDLGVNKGTEHKLLAFVELLDSMRTRTEAGGDFSELAEWLIAHTGIPAELKQDSSVEGKGRYDNVQELLTSMIEYARSVEPDSLEPTLENYLSHIALMTDQDTSDEKQTPGVTLMTVHASKGLEFPHVFIVGLEEQLFPSPLCTDQRELEEERRLLYVAITRAERTCHISYARERFRNGRIEFSRPSRFIKELPAGLLKYDTIAREHLDSVWQRMHDTPADMSPRQRPTPKKEVSLGLRSADVEEQHERVGDLSVGAKVLHAKFGLGTIELLEGSSGNEKATVRFENSGDRKKLLLRFAHLTLV